MSSRGWGPAPTTAQVWDRIMACVRPVTEACVGRAICPRQIVVLGRR